MKIQLLGWESKGLRCPDISVTLIRDDGSIPKISLIQMPNGTGKTTTLSCLRAAMDGTAETWSAIEVAKYRCVDENVQQGYFAASLLVNDSQKIAIEMTFHFDEGAVTYQTIVGSSSKDNYSPPPEVRRYLDPKFSELLFFDGETAHSLLDGESGTSASQIIDTFYGLYHFTELKIQARENYILEESRSGPTRGAAEAAKLAKKRDSMIQKARDLKGRTKENSTRQTELEGKHALIESELEGHLLKSEKYKDDETRGREELNHASEQLQMSFHRLDNVLPNPWSLYPSFAERVGNLVENLDEVKLIEQPPRLYLEELAKSDTCVCDRPMDECASSAVSSKAAHVLDDSVTGFLKSLKRDVLSRKNQEVNLFTKIVNEIQRADNLLTAAQESLMSIRNRAEAEGDKEVEQKKGELQSIADEIDELKIAINVATQPASHKGGNDKYESIDYYEKRANELDNELAKLSGTRDLKYRTDKLIELVDEAYEEAHAAMKEEVVVRANDRLAQILRYNPVQIKDIEKSVVLDGRGGASVGQTLAVGYVFLAGLLHEGGNQFPMVVDSPVGSLDDEARRELGGLLPILTKQVVSFVIASERKWFVDSLENACDDEVLFLTHLRINEYTKEIISNLQGERLSETPSGVLIGGRNAFMSLGEDVEETS